MSSIQRQKIICLAGPTAIGKTELSLKLAAALHTEIISADSVSLYKGMDIGSAKPSIEERRSIPHHMIDCIDIGDRSFSVSVYRNMAADAIRKMVEKNMLPLIVGGSGLYMDSLIKPLNFACPSDPVVRAQLEREYLTEDPGRAWNALKQVDEITAARLHPNDRKRIIRALEIYRLSGRPLSSYGNDFSNSSKADGEYDPRIYILETDRTRLYERIEKRADIMLQKGLEKEVRHLYDAGYDLSFNPMQSLGYKQFVEYFQGVRSFEETVEKIKTDTRHFAKRQISWFNRYENAVHIVIDDTTSADALAESIVNDINTWGAIQ